MRRAITAAVACVAMMMASRMLAAHHSFSAEFDASQPVSLDGTVSRLAWTNPHAWIYLTVVDSKGDVITWAIEASSPGALARRGLRWESVPPGTKVIVHGYRAKNRTPTARGRDLTLPDGRIVLLGSPETGSPEPAR